MTEPTPVTSASPSPDVRRSRAGLLMGPRTAQALPRQGYRRLNELVREEWRRPTFGLLRLFRLAVLALTYLSPTILIDQVVRTTDRSVVGLTRELVFVLPRDVFFVLALVTSLNSSVIALAVVAFLVLDVLCHLAGSALVWGNHSINPQRSLIFALVNYFEITIAYAVAYKHFACLNVLIPSGTSVAAPPSALQAVYFSLVTATTVGYGDITPKGSLGQGLVVSQLALFATFVLILLTSLHSRAAEEPTGATLPILSAYDS